MTTTIRGAPREGGRVAGTAVVPVDGDEGDAVLPPLHPAAPASEPNPSRRSRMRRNLIGER
jgi:hypothetical protein